MSDDTPLFLHEEMLLLALRDDEGTPEFGAWYAQAVAGAVLAELLLRGRVTIDDASRRTMTVRVKDATPTGDALVDECLEMIRDDKKERPAQHWVTRFSSIRDASARVARKLVRRGILRADEKKVLLFFTRKVFPEIDPRPEREIVERIRRAVFGESREIDPRTSVLVSIAYKSGLLRPHFEKKELRARQKRLEQIRSGELVAGATGDAIEAVQAAQAAAIMVTIMIPAIAASTTHH
jgi:hypothetical protein